MTTTNVWLLPQGRAETGPDCTAMKCGICNAIVRIRLPISVDELVPLTRDFERRHMRCVEMDSNDPRHPWQRNLTAEQHAAIEQHNFGATEEIARDAAPEVTQ